MKKLSSVLAISMFVITGAYAFPEAKNIESSSQTILSDKDRTVEIESFGEELEQLKDESKNRQTDIQNKITKLNIQIKELNKKADDAENLISSVRSMLEGILSELERTDKLKQICSTSKEKINQEIFNLIESYKTDPYLNYSSEKLAYEENKLRSRNASVIAECEKDIRNQLRKELLAKERAIKLYRLVATLKGEIVLDKNEIEKIKTQVQIINDYYRNSLK
jgi:TolA-binding protein